MKLATARCCCLLTNGRTGKRKIGNRLSKRLQSSICWRSNNSVVGTSKFLHFVAPEVFPIWDSRIAAVFGFRHGYQINNALNYTKYCNTIPDRLARPIDWPKLLANDETGSRKDNKRSEA